MYVLWQYSSVTWRFVAATDQLLGKTVVKNSSGTKSASMNSMYLSSNPISEYRNFDILFRNSNTLSQTAAETKWWSSYKETFLIKLSEGRKVKVGTWKQVYFIFPLFIVPRCEMSPRKKLYKLYLQVSIFSNIPSCYVTAACRYSTIHTRCVVIDCMAVLWNNRAKQLKGTVSPD